MHKCGGKANYKDLYKRRFSLSLLWVFYSIGSLGARLVCWAFLKESWNLLPQTKHRRLKNHQWPHQGTLCNSLSRNSTWLGEF